VKAEEHNRLVGWLQIGYGAVFLLMLTGFFLLFGSVWISDPGPRGPQDDSFFAVMMTTVFAVNMLFAMPSFVAGFGLLNRKRWAKNWGLIASVICGMSSPLGLPLCIYTIWFLTGDLGKELYPKSETRFAVNELGALHSAPTTTDWAERSRNRDYSYPSKFEPPNWRGE
jgi:hypothetical protein